mmetsp:Transcript_66373/g.154238  ORF Transcript_66373/g.154238 Transcript_66373/m.154238 type:complete len:111 (+) Transcript_66373:101-433(+)
MSRAERPMQTPMAPETSATLTKEPVNTAITPLFQLCACDTQAADWSGTEAVVLAPVLVMVLLLVRVLVSVIIVTVSVVAVCVEVLLVLLVLVASLEPTIQDKQPSNEEKL